MGVTQMDQFTAFMAQLDKTLAQEQLSSTDLVYVPVTFSFHNQRLQVAINMLQTSFNQGNNVFGVPDVGRFGISWSPAVSLAYEDNDPATNNHAT